MTDKFELILWMTIVITIGAIAGYAIHCSFRENRLYIEHGYTQKAMPGMSDTHWVKGDCQ